MDYGSFTRSGTSCYYKDALFHGLNDCLSLLFCQKYSRPVLDLVNLGIYLFHIRLIMEKRKFQKLFSRRYFRVIHGHKIYGVYALDILV